MSTVQHNAPGQIASEGVKVTPAALAHIKNQLIHRGSGIGVRLWLKEAGCSGFSYELDYVDQSSQQDDIPFKIDDNVTVFVDFKSYNFIKGTEIDFVKKGLNAQFAFKNPNSTGTCGCGESFTVG